MVFMTKTNCLYCYAELEIDKKDKYFQCPFCGMISEQKTYYSM